MLSTDQTQAESIAYSGTKVPIWLIIESNIFLIFS